MHEERKKIYPIYEPQEEFIRTWENISYKGRGFDMDASELYSERGERVRSKSEVLIADILNKDEIPYHYELPLYLNGYCTVYPDFTVLNINKRKTIYWEHLGMMDDFSYVENAFHKIYLYVQNEIFPGDKLILTFETRKKPLDRKQIEGLVIKYLKE